MLGFKDPSWQNWGGDETEMFEDYGFGMQKPHKVALLRFGAPNTSHKLKRLPGDFSVVR